VVNNKDIIGTVGRARISSKFYKCGSFDDMGNKLLQGNRHVEVFHHQQLTEKSTAVKLFRSPARPLHWSDFFTPPLFQREIFTSPFCKGR
jgi:hypothetical protein